jgi:hypothetical protein
LIYKVGEFHNRETLQLWVCFIDNRLASYRYLLPVASLHLSA